MSGADAGLVFALATEICALREQLAEAQDLLFETAVDAGDLHARLEQRGLNGMRCAPSGMPGEQRRRGVARDVPYSIFRDLWITENALSI